MPTEEKIPDRKSVIQKWSLAEKAMRGLLTFLPPWLSNVFDQIGRSIDREYNFRVGQRFSPRVLGVFAGQMKASSQLFGRKSQTEKFASPEVKKLLRQIRQGFKQFRPLLEESYRLLTANAEKLSLKEQAEFERGKAASLEKNAKDPVFFRTDATELYGVLICLFPFMSKIRSVRELHEILVQIMGERAGDLKRVESICHRIKLKFGPPGRPKKNLP